MIVVCPKCNGNMEAGYLLDETQSASNVSHWVEGPPDRNAFTGMKTKGRRKLPITVFRCARCGFLEAWAAGLA